MEGLTETSSTVVDISGDNDNAGAVAAAATIPTVNADAPFERSCDNPECSAPKLISLVPKRETPEFITEPVIMNQPTLINGFTTVFQIDGIGAKMNDIMYGDQSASTASKPKSVFRIVPNTHAHIVNYVVVDGAGETMRKIKGNDVDTMRKLLDSQRLSAEQMLKKLIGKAFKTQSQPQVSLPINCKVQMPSPKAPSVPVISSGAAQANALPVVPPGITITPLPLPDGMQIGTSAPAATKQTPTTSGSASKMTTSSVETLPMTTTTTTAIPSKTHTAQKTSPTTITPITITPTTITPTTTTPTITTPTTSAATSTPTVSTTTTPAVSIETFPTATTPPAAPSAPILRRVLDTRSTAAAQEPKNTPPVTRFGRPNILKRQRLDDTPEPQTIKRLRPRSPKIRTPMATGLKWNKVPSPPPTKKLPTLPKLPTKPAGKVMEQREASVPQAAPLPTKKLLVAPKTTKEHLPATTNVPALICNETLPIKTKPIMGPASKMNALRAMAAAKAAVAHVTNAEQLNTNQSRAPKIIKLSETLTTASALPVIKPCSVAIEKTDIPINIIIKPTEAVNQESIESSPSSDSISDSVPPHTSPIKVASGLTSKSDTPSTPKVTVGPDSKASQQSVPKTNAAKPMVSAGVTSKPGTPLTSKAVEAPQSKPTILSALRARAAAAASKAHLASIVKPTGDKDPLALGETLPSEVKDLPTTPKLVETSVAKANVSSNTSKVVGGPSPKGVVLLRPTTSKIVLLSKPDGSSKSAPDREQNPKTTATSSPKPDTPLVSKANVAPVKTVTEAALPTKVTRSSTPKANALSKVSETSTKSSSPSSAQSRNLKVVLPTLKSGVMSIPVRSPHPNLKIASVISGGSAVAAATSARNTSVTKLVLNESGGPDIEKLHQELAVLRRTVARLTKKKT